MHSTGGESLNEDMEWCYFIRINFDKINGFHHKADISFYGQTPLIAQG